MTDERSDWIKGYEAGAKEAAPIAYRKAAEVVRERAKAHKRGLGLLLTETERYALLATAIEALAKE